MGGYHNDYTCSMYDFYMLTGEGAEYFEDITDEEDLCSQEECEQDDEPCFETLDEQLDYIIECLEEEIKERKRFIAEQKIKDDE